MKQAKRAFWPLFLSSAAILALLIGSLCLGPANPDALPLNHLEISEVMVENLSAYPDEDGAYYSWAEITNHSSLPIDLSDLRLTDDPERPDRYTFPNEVLPAGESVVVFLTGDSTETRPYHTSFSLKNGAESLYLFSGPRTMVSSLTVPESPADRSYGYSNGEPVWFAVASPGALNTGICSPTLMGLEDAMFTGVLINEVCAVSRATDTDYPCDWIELYNTTDTAVDLNGYRLTEDPAVQGFTFGAVMLAPQEYLLVYCDKDAVAQERALHAPFSLNRNGDEIYLITPDGVTADSFSTGKQRYGISSGRIENDRRTRGFFSTPTPAAKNSAALSGYAAAPVIDRIGGYVTSGDAVTISVPYGCRVYYTTNGAVPTEQSVPYTAGTVITLNKTTVLRAIAYRDGYLPSDAVTHTYLTDSPHDIPVVSISAAPALLFGANGAWTNYKNESLQPTVHAEYFTKDGIKELDFDSIFRIAGGWSRTNVQKGFSLNLNQTTGESEIEYPFFKDSEVTVFHNLLLRPSGSDWKDAKLRDEFVAQALKNTDGQLIQSAQPVALYINGNYYGLYYLREKRNEDFIASYTEIPAENVQLVQHPALDDRTTKLDPDLQALITYAKKNDLTKDEHYQYVLSQIDADSLMQYFAYQTFFGNGDCINNIACYRDNRGGKWKWIVFDTDWACTSYYAGRNFLQQLYNGTAYATYQNYHYPLFTALLKNEEFRTDFLETYARLLQTTLSQERLLPIFNSLADEIESEIPRQYKRFGAPSVARWTQQIRYIRSFIEKREAVITAQLKGTFSLTDEEWDVLYHSVTK
ncbi:MAG: CotH kinase family protein [Clostridia bacterium]|nr:CotH kinase family protein [Clostridia bacterium]